MRRFLSTLSLLLVVPLTGGCEGPVQPVVAPGDQVAFTLTSTAAAKGAFTEISLGHLGGGGTVAQAINNGGQVVGSSRTQDGVTHAFVWNPREGMSGIPGSWLASDINESGTVVLTYVTYPEIGTSQVLAWTWSSQHGHTGVNCGLHPYPLSINNRGTFVGIKESAFYFELPSGYLSILSAFMVIDGECAHIHSPIRGFPLDGEFAALTAHIINERGEVSGWGGRYVPHPVLIYGDYLIIDDELQPYVWSPARGFVIGNTLDDDRHRNSRGDYVDGGSLFTTNPQRYGFRPDTGLPLVGSSAPAALHGAAAAAEERCTEILEWARDGAVERMSDCLLERRKAGGISSLGAGPR
jgi:probable HAF family extracellular repeat protein